MLMAEISAIKIRLRAQQETIESLRAKNVQLLAERDCHEFKRTDNAEKNDQDESEFVNLVGRYVGEIEDLRTKLCEAESTCEILRRQVNSSRLSLKAENSPSNIDSPNRAFGGGQSVLEAAKADIERLRTKLESKRSSKEGVRLRSNGLSVSLNDISDLPATTPNGEITDTADNVSDDEDSTEDDSAETEGEQLEANLAELQCEISIKERLVEELEQSQRRLLTLKQQYEEKLRLLQTRIRDTEMERDRVLSTLGTDIHYC